MSTKSKFKAFDLDNYKESKKVFPGSTEHYMLAYDHAWKNLVKSKDIPQKTKTVMLKFLANQMAIVMHLLGESSENNRFIESYRQFLINSKNFSNLSNFDEILIDIPSRLAEVLFTSLVDISSDLFEINESNSRLESKLKGIFFRCPLSTIHVMVDITTL